MNIDIIICEMTPKMLAPPYDKYAKAVTVRGLYNLCEIVGGRKIYIPKPEAMVKYIIKEMVIEDYYSGNYTIEELAKKYGRATKTIWNYIKGK